MHNFCCTSVAYIIDTSGQDPLYQSSACAARILLFAGQTLQDSVALACLVMMSARFVATAGSAHESLFAPNTSVYAPIDKSHANILDI